MVLVGGITRLTGSGLSMTNWKPVTGWLPPISEAQWQDEFSFYKQSPEFIKINSYMQLNDFKEIFWLEYVHRIAGRLTGVIFLLPLLFFTIRGWLERSSTLKLLGIFTLGGAQGIVGWLMVSSGLKDAPHVSQYWLAFHLISAFIIFSLTLLMALHMQFKDNILRLSASHKSLPQLKFFAILSLIALFVQSAMGALVAGLSAGKIYNTYPLMDGKFLPDGFGSIAPFYLNLFENIALVQFNHRHFAIFVLMLATTILFIAHKSNFSKAIRTISIAVVSIISVQILVGINTLLLAVPIYLGSLHQMVALVAISVTVFLNYALFSRKIG